MSKYVLLVEDDANLRFLLGEILETIGVDYLAVGDGEACLAQLEKSGSECGLVLLDMYLPGISGHNAIKAIRALENESVRAVPVVMFSSDPKWAADESLKELGVECFLPKPASIDQLRDICTRYLAD